MTPTSHMTPSATAAKPTILVVDDHAVVREGLCSLLSIKGHFAAVLQAEDGPQAVTLAQQRQPDLIMVDLLMPGMTGVEAIPLLRQAAPAARLVVLTSTEEPTLAMSALKAGANSFLLKSMSGTDILASLDLILDGEEVIHPSVSSAVLKASLREAGQGDPFAMLTPREIDVLRELANGASNARIAQALNIAERTVKSHIGNVFSKLNLADRTEAVAFAWRNGLIEK